MAKHLFERSIYFNPNAGNKGILDVVDRYLNNDYKVRSFEPLNVYTTELDDDNTSDDYYRANGFIKLAERRYNTPIEIIEAENEDKIAEAYEDEKKLAEKEIQKEQG